jgi:hypothetical protein
VALRYWSAPIPHIKLISGQVTTSHHLDSPLARQDVRLDITDLYCFRGEFGTALIINLCHSIAGDIPEPGFHPEGMYEFKIDTNNDSIEDLTYRVIFKERTADGHQHICLYRITGAQATDPHAEGKLLAEGSTGREVSAMTGARLWAGKAGDPFWIDPNVLRKVGHAFQDGTAVGSDPHDHADPKNLFAGHTVYSIVLELPDSELLPDAKSNRNAGVWAIASLTTDAGGWRPINRVGLPMIHPLFTQFDEDLGDLLNFGRPADDFRTFSAPIVRAIQRTVSANGTSENAEEYGVRIARKMLPNVLPYAVGTQAVFGMGVWNGRTMTDNVADVMFSTAANTPIRLGIGKESVTSKPTTTFPYVPPVATQTTR